MVDIIDGRAFLALGPERVGFFSFFFRSEQNPRPVFRNGVLALGSINGVKGQCGFPDGPQPTIGPFRGFAGVFGTSRDDTGVAGTSVGNIGVYGQTEEIDRTLVLFAGVYGAGNTRPGVFGVSKVGIGVEGGSGTQGPPVPNLPTAGVIGSSADHPGVLGTSNRGAGVHVFSSNNVGIIGQTANDVSFAGAFLGNVVVTRNLTVSGTKSAAVPFPDGTQRLLYCMESPELWFEDFGAAKLKAGRAVVKLDADFAKMIKRGDYKVFLTPEGDCHGLYVRRRAASFDVRELAGGKSSVAFSYRIVARRKDIRVKRFAKIDTRLRLPRQGRT